MRGSFLESSELAQMDTWYDTRSGDLLGDGTETWGPDREDTGAARDAERGDRSAKSRNTGNTGKAAAPSFTAGSAAGILSVCSSAVRG